MDDLLTALALVLVIEGSLYALFPGTMRQALEAALALPAGVVRTAGLVAACLGVGLVWMLRG
ncbi:DUF2065 domain-containing protein [Arenibaculum pallidiluteum]|uniref:DUF2065 domain-containing protein n=1 Tax=Arenibaculum pallidiluteum TaxID=2812559 RepID=UPI001A973E1D|nr:DUF2065 domain-containing protein [Arenibaculum pallidiluteum]